MWPQFSRWSGHLIDRRNIVDTRQSCDEWRTGKVLRIAALIPTSLLSYVTVSLPPFLHSISSSFLISATLRPCNPPSIPLPDCPSDTPSVHQSFPFDPRSRWSTAGLLLQIYGSPSRAIDVNSLSAANNEASLTKPINRRKQQQQQQGCGGGDDGCCRSSGEQRRGRDLGPQLWPKTTDRKEVLRPLDFYRIFTFWKGNNCLMSRGINWLT